MDDGVGALYNLEVFDSLGDEEFNDLVKKVAAACETPYACVAIRHGNRWLAGSAIGFDIDESTVHPIFLPGVLAETEPLVVPDAAVDSRFSGNPVFPAYPRIASFAAFPLRPEYIPGYLIVASDKPRLFSAVQLAFLELAAAQVMSLLRLRLQVQKMEKIEEDYRSGEEQMNTIFLSAIDAVVIVDASGKISQWNPKAEAIFGWKKSEVRGRYFQELIIHPDHREAYLGAMKQHAIGATGPDAERELELTAMAKNGDTFDIAVGISSTKIKGQRYYINFASDITERKKATEKLDQQKEFYENILNQLPTDIAVFDANHKYLFVNPGAIKDPELRKYIVGKDDFQYAEYRNRDQSVAQKRRDQFLQVKNSGKEIRWEDNTVRDPVTGNTVTHLRRLFPVFDANDRLSLVIGFGIDITDRKIMEEKQTALVKQLSAQNTQLIDFCNIVSHNLRGPLVNMSMLVDFIEESTDDQEQEMLIAKLRPVLENLHTTFNELVESIQIKQDLEIKSEKISLDQCLQRTIDGLKTEISKSEAKIECDFSQAPVIYFPAKYLLSIFHNLVSNSLKYQSPDRPPLIRLVTTRQEDSIILSVKDNGLGIDMAKHKDNIFKIGRVFHRHPNAKGFGLFMTRTQVEAMDGKIWAESEPGEGATFFIEFKNQNK